MRINPKLTVDELAPAIGELWRLSGPRITGLERDYDFSRGAPVFTAGGKYTARGWTEWTLGFHYGSALLQFEATGDEEFLELGRRGTCRRMLQHLTHMGVHDHGFNIVSTFGNLRRLIGEGAIVPAGWEKEFYELGLRCSGAVQARRWTQLPRGGYIYSFNGPHSLFADTMRSLRSLAWGHLLGQHLLEEGDRAVSLLGRLVQHARTTAEFNVYYGLGRDQDDVRGRVAHESIFNLSDGAYRCPSSQQGFSPRTTWTRGLAWILLGYAEQLEFLSSLQAWDQEAAGDRREVLDFVLEAARATADFYLEHTPTNGIPYWDTGAPGLARMGDYLERPAEPVNDFEPVDSSAAAIAGQGLLRLGRYLSQAGDPAAGSRYWQAGLTVAAALFDDPYLSRDPGHAGLILHSVYHRPNGWDFIPPGRRIPCGEAGMWGDYHGRELALYLQRLQEEKGYLRFWIEGD